MDITKDEFVEWKQSKITKAVFGRLESLQWEAKEAITEVVQDRENYLQKVGYIQGINECLRVEFEDDNAESTTDSGGTRT